jgi:hypothetical protein
VCKCELLSLLGFCTVLCTQAIYKWYCKIDIENLKVHKNENFLASILNFVLFHC